MKINTLISIFLLSLLFSNVFAQHVTDTVSEYSDTIKPIIRTFTGHTDWVDSGAVSPDGRYALSGSSNECQQFSRSFHK